MGRKGTGVEVRGNAIHIQFSLNGEVVRRTLRREGTPVPPAPSATPNAFPRRAKKDDHSPSTSTSTHGWRSGA